MGLSDRTALVTGGNRGIGRATALGLARAGMRVVLVSRSPVRGRRAQREIIEESGNERVEVLSADLASLASVRQLASAFLARYDALHVLIHNAATIENEYTESADGVERTFAINHLAPFQLTRLLLPALEAGAPSRVVLVSADAHRRVKSAPTPPKPGSYDRLDAYHRSKLANLMYMHELARRVEDRGITVNALTPGVVATDLLGKYQGLTPEERARGEHGGVPPAKGADTVIYLATSPDLEGVTGRYFKDRRERRVSSLAADDEAASALWKYSEELVEEA